MALPTEPECMRDNGPMDEKPWSRMRASIYSFFARNPESNRMIAEVAALRDSDRALDIGCGPGAAVRGSAQIVSEALGVDPSLHMVAIATRRSAGIANVRFEAGAAERLPFADASFTVIWTVHAFHHWADQTKGLEEVVRVLRPGGRLYVIERETKGQHGLTRAAAENLASRMDRSGFIETTVAKRKKELIVSGYAPQVADE